MFLLLLWNFRQKLSKQDKNLLKNVKNKTQVVDKQSSNFQFPYLRVEIETFPQKNQINFQ